MSKLLAETDALVDRIYDAALDLDAWEAVLKVIADNVDAVGGLLVGHSVHDRLVFSIFQCRCDLDCQKVYVEQHIQNPWSMHMVKQPVGKIVASDEILTARELARADFSAEVLQPQGFAHGAMAALANRPGFVAAFNILRGSDRGPFQTRELAWLSALLPHLRRSVELNLRSDAYGALRGAELAVLDELAYGVLVLDRGGRVLEANRAARRSLERDGPITTWDGVPVPRGRASRVVFNRLLADALRGGPGGGMQLEGAQGGRTIALIVPLRGLISRTLQGQGLRDPAALLLLAVDRPSVALSTTLSQVFGLTRAEGDVAVQLAAGASMPAIAAALGLSINTVKTHARRVFGKAGVRGQVEFVRATALLQMRSPSS